MTCGIYIIEFKTPVWGWYIGQSKNIEARWLQHKKDYSDGNSQKKLHEAFSNVKQPPIFKILIECHEDWLNILEEEFYAAYIQRDMQARRSPYWKSLNTKVLSENKYLIKDLPYRYKHNPKAFIHPTLSKKIALGLRDLG